MIRNTRTANHWLWIVGSVLIVLLTIIWLSPKASADDSYSNLDVAIYGPNAYLNAPITHMKIVANGKVDVTVKDACVDSTAGSPGMTATIDGQTRSSNSHCSNGNLFFNNVNPGVIKFEKINGQGHQPFDLRVTGSGSYITHRDNPNRGTSDYGNDGNVYGFAKWGGLEFDFTVPCNYSDGNSAVYYKWKDVDEGQFNQNSGAYIRIDDLDDSDPSRRIDNLGKNNNETGYANLNAGSTRFQKGHRYRITWHEVNASGNAIQHVLPFDRLPSPNCDDEPTGGFDEIECKPRDSRDYLRGFAGDPDRPNNNVQYRVYISGSLRMSGTTSGTHNGAREFRHNTSFIHGYASYAAMMDALFPQRKTRNFELHVRNINPDGSLGGWVKVRDVNRAAGRCVAPPCTLGQPGCPVNKDPCFYYTHTDNGGSAPNYTYTQVNIDGYQPVNGDNGRVGGWYPKTKEWKYIPSNKNVSIQVIQYRWTKHTRDTGEVDKEGNPIYEDYYQWDEISNNTTVHGCYSAKCTIDPNSVRGTGREGMVTNNSSVTVSVTITNDGKHHLPSHYLYTWPLGLRTFQGERPWGVELYPGESETRDETFSTPGTAQIYNLTMHPAYTQGGFDLGPTCSQGVNVYEPFTANVSAYAKLQPDVEDPSRVDYSTTVCNSASVAVRIPTNSRVHKTTAAGANSTLGSNSGGDYPNGCSYAYGPGNFGISGHNAGDKYCSDINAGYSEGWVGGYGPGDVRFTGTPRSAQHCDTVENWPYMHVYGSDAIASGGFPENCGGISSGIYARNRGNRGSGTQFAASALNNITGFMSASTRTSAPVLPNGLSFSNTTNPPGQFGGDGWCADDYFTDTALSRDDSRRTDTNSSTVNVSSLGNGRQTHVNINGGRATINGATFTSRHAVYVDGDAYITSNISYGSENPSWSNINAIPNFALIVRGNIFIDKSVTRLDGLYVAQPRGGSAGHIYTCTRSSGDPVFQGNEIWSNCGNQLKVFGSFIANYVHFHRSYKTLRDSAAREPYSSSDAAELFIFTPEAYLSQPVFRPRGSLSGGNYDYITTLPPVL